MSWQNKKIKTPQQSKKLISLSLDKIVSSSLVLIQKHEKIVAIGMALIVLAFIPSPILYFSLFPKNGLIFLGRRDLNWRDVYTYVSYIEQAKEGRWLSI